MSDHEGSQPSVGGGGDGIEPTASEVAHGLQIIAETIKDEKIKEELQNIISKIAHGSVQERSYNILTENLRSFVTNLGSSVHFSLSQTKQIIKTIIVLWNKPFIAKHVMKEVYNEDIGDESETEVPKDVKNMNEKAIEIYSKALKDGKEEIRNIRLMVLGMFGVGKTSLVNNLIKDFRDKKIVPQSTEGIDLHKCQLMENGDWCLDNEHALTKYQSRFKKGFKEISISTLSTMSVRDESDIKPVQDAPVAGNIFVNQSDTRSLDTITKSVKQHIEEDIVKDVLPTDEVQNEIVREQDVKQVPSKATNTTVSVWDFAGQTLYYSTHQFFLNKRSIYLVLMDMTKSLDDHVREDDELSGIWCGLMKNCTYLEVFKFWLNAIHMYSGYRSSVGNLKPSIVLVGTRKDEMVGNNEEKEITNDKYFENALLRAFEKDSPILNHIHPRRFLVNNLSPADPVFNELRTEILGLAESQEYWGEKSPLKWIPLEQSLDKLRDEGKQLLKMEDIEKANTKSAHPLGGDELTLFLDIQHIHGNILYFNTDQLKNLIVLAPQWIIQAFKCFITHIMNKIPRNLDAWNAYIDLAILKPEVFNEIMDKSERSVGENRFDVIKYMEHLDVMAKPLKLEEVKEAINTAADHQIEEYKVDAVALTKYLDFHIVPCRLKKPPPPISKFTSPPETCKSTQVLCFVFCEKFMPPSFFHRLVAVCIRTWPISQEDNKNQLYNGLAVFDLRHAYTLTIWYEDHIIYARISSCSKLVADFDVTLCQECQDVRHTLRISLLNFVGQSVENPRTATAFDEYIQCPCMQECLPNKGMLRVKEFMYEYQLNCTACRKRHTVTRAEALNYWFKNELDQADKNDDNFNRPAQESDLLGVAKSVGNEFWMLGIELGLTDVQMNQLYDAPECRREQCTFVYKYLVKWRNNKGDKATLQLLNRAKNAARLYCSKSHTEKQN